MPKIKKEHIKAIPEQPIKNNEELNQIKIDLKPILMDLGIISNDSTNIDLKSFSENNKKICEQFKINDLNKCIGFINVTEEIDIFSKEFFSDLIKEKQEHPYLMIVGQTIVDKKSIFRYFDADNLVSWIERECTDPLNRQKFESLYIYEIKKNEKKFELLEKQSNMIDTKFIKLFVEVHESNDHEKQGTLGSYYIENKEFKKAFIWLEKSALQGNRCAQFSLGNCYRKGKGVEQNYKKAFEWYEKSALQGEPLSQNHLGCFYLSGIGVKKNHKKAFELFEKSALQGEPNSQNNLALCYLNGIGVKKNREKAVEWFQKAADQGHSEAKKSLQKMSI